MFSLRCVAGDVFNFYKTNAEFIDLLCIAWN